MEQKVMMGWALFQLSLGPFSSVHGVIGPEVDVCHVTPFMMKKEPTLLDETTSSPALIRPRKEKREKKEEEGLSKESPLEESRPGIARMLTGMHVPLRTRVNWVFASTLICLLVAAQSTSNDSQVKCSRTCVAENCNSIGIRYGKYCGVGWTGCPGEKPCDDLDACCKIHDECVEQKGLINVKCHEKFKRCIKKVQKSKKVGFSRDCPYDTAVPTMVQGMDMAILFSQFGNSHIEL